jgi:hypothetical protein
MNDEKINQHSFIGFKRRTEASQLMPFRAGRLPAKNSCIGEFTWEFPPNTIHTEIRLAKPVKNRPYWSLWTKGFCSTVDFIDGEEAAELKFILPAESDDIIEKVIQYLLIQFLNGPNTNCHSYSDITDLKFDESILYSAVLSLDKNPVHSSRIKEYLESSHDHKGKIIENAFPEFRDRVTQRCDAI